MILPCLIASICQGQFAYERFENFKKIDLPFEYKNNLIIVDVTLNRLFPLKFIFDTGAENTILAKREVTDMLKVAYEREFKLLGSDMTTELTAYLVRDIHFKSHDLVIPSHGMLVLKEDYFRFEEVAGIEVHGILGADVFRNLVVRINYDRKIITLSKRPYFKRPNDYEEIPIEVSRSKPYIRTKLQISPDSTLSVKLLLDSGAMLPFILNTNTDSSLHLPPTVINGKLGAGLGGYLEGFVGRVHSLDFGSKNFKEVVTNFQDISAAIDTSLLNGRNGIIGNQILNRFHIIFDYPTEKIYVKPNRRYKNKFKFDKSGMVIIAADINLNSFIVHEVIANSPAYEAGVKPGDKLTSINGLPPALLSLNNINKILSKREGKKIKLRVKRNEERILFKFKLRKLI
ncbi:MAG: PDZ domain-containing protein [Bacteroidota bacterium]